jgi:cytochrome c biogenesis protein CcdA
MRFLKFIARFITCFVVCIIVAGTFGAAALANWEAYTVVSLLAAACWDALTEPEFG